MVRRGVQQLIGGFALGLIAIAMLYSASLFALRVMGYEYAVVVSNSMLPIAQRGDLVIVKPSHEVSLRRVVLFRRGDALVLHRLIKQNPDNTWRTRGDANDVADPWVITSDDVVGTAFGVLRGFGVPMLLLAEEPTASAHAAFTKSKSRTSKVGSGFWITPLTYWTVYSLATSFNAPSSPPISINGQGDRRLWTSVRYTNLTRIHYEGYMSRFDPVGIGYSFVFNACVSTSDAISCGWSLFFSPPTRTVSLQAFKSDGSLTLPLATCSVTNDLGGQNTIALRSQSGAMTLFINGEQCMKLTTMTNLLTGTGAPTPSGGFAGVRCLYTNRLYMQKLYFW